MSEIITETENKDIVLEFGLYENYNKNIEQRQEGIFYINNNDGIEIKTVLLDGVLTSIKYYVDNLELIDNYYQITYYNNLTKKETIYKGTLKDIAKELENEVEYIRANNDILALLGAFKRQTINKDLLEVINYYSINGYFIHNNEFIDNNTDLKHYDDLSDDNYKKQLQEAVNKLNNYLDDLHPKYIGLFKIMLLTPYYYIFRQLDIQAPIVFIYLYGKGKAGKSTTVKSFMSLYENNPQSESSTTTPNLRNSLAKYDTRILFADEIDSILTGTYKQKTLALLKEARYNLNIAGKTDQNDYDKNKYFNNFRYVVGTTNEPTNFAEGLNRALYCQEFLYHITNAELLDEKYSDINLGIVGHSFSKYITKLYNNGDFKKSFRNKNKVNETINQLLINIEDDYDLTFNKKSFNLNPYTDNDNVKRDINITNETHSKIVNSVNKYMKKYYNTDSYEDVGLNYIKERLSTKYKRGLKIRYDKNDNKKYYIMFTEDVFNKFINDYCESSVLNNEEFLQEVYETNVPIHDGDISLEYNELPYLIKRRPNSKMKFADGSRHTVHNNIIFDKVSIKKLLFNV